MRLSQHHPREQTGLAPGCRLGVGNGPVPQAKLGQFSRKSPVESGEDLSVNSYPFAVSIIQRNNKKKTGIILFYKKG